MHVILRWLSDFLAVLCKIFSVDSTTLRNGRRGNLPPPTGGIASE
ncbi:MAG: hypothetical protein NXI13_05250 [Proteobacteria bacterium]|nr:hypothetical protein [Pseudomonadota bacterium]